MRNAVDLDGLVALVEEQRIAIRATCGVLQMTFDINFYGRALAFHPAPQGRQQFYELDRGRHANKSALCQTIAEILAFSGLEVFLAN